MCIRDRLAGALQSNIKGSDKNVKAMDLDTFAKKRAAPAAGKAGGEEEGSADDDSDSSAAEAEITDHLCDYCFLTKDG
eukprot:13045971-Alexandrium_andersonii.AAC.1